MAYSTPFLANPPANYRRRAIFQQPRVRYISDLPAAQSFLGQHRDRTNTERDLKLRDLNARQGDSTHSLTTMLFTADFLWRSLIAIVERHTYNRHHRRRYQSPPTCITELPFYPPPPQSHHRGYINGSDTATVVRLSP